MPLLLARQLAVGTWLRRGMVVLVHGPATPQQCAFSNPDPK